MSSRMIRELDETESRSASRNPGFRRELKACPLRVSTASLGCYLTYLPPWVTLVIRAALLLRRVRMSFPDPWMTAPMLLAAVHGAAPGAVGPGHRRRRPRPRAS